MLTFIFSSNCITLKRAYVKFFIFNIEYLRSILTVARKLTSTIFSSVAHVATVQQFCNAKSNRNEGALFVLIGNRAGSACSEARRESTCELDWTSLDYVHPPHPRVSSEIGKEAPSPRFLSRGTFNSRLFHHPPRPSACRPAHPRGDSPSVSYKPCLRG